MSQARWRIYFLVGMSVFGVGCFFMGQEDGGLQAMACTWAGAFAVGALTKHVEGV